MSGSLESVRWNARVHRLDLGLYSHPKELEVMESESILTPRENPFHRRLREGQTREAAPGRTASSTHYQLSYSGPRSLLTL